MIRIVEIRGREVLDSRGRPTVEAEAVLSDGTRERASVPSGASTGRHEAHELRDGDPARYDGLGVLRAVRNVTEELGPAVAGRDARDQAGLDDALVRLDGTPDRSRLGANALLAVSLAVARAAATASGVPLWRYLGGGAAPVLPLPMVNIVSGGLHAGRNLDFQDFLVIPVGAKSYFEALESATAVYRATSGLLAERGLSTLKGDEGGFGPKLGRAEAVLDLLVEAIERTGRDVALALDVAATHLYEGGRYRLPREGLDLDASGLVDLLAGLAARYPLVSIEDGLAEDDWDGWRTLTSDLGSTVQLVGDDLFTTNPERLRLGIERGAANAILVKMNQIGTLTETLAVVEQARRAGYRAIVSARSGETEDPFLADLAVATGAGQIKVGSVAQSERLAKYNQLLRIEEELGGKAEFPGGALLR